jgi:hypothetical protein
MENVNVHNQHNLEYVWGDKELFHSIYDLKTPITQEGSNVRVYNKNVLHSNPMMLEGDSEKDKVDLHYASDPSHGFHNCLLYGPYQKGTLRIESLPACSTEFKKPSPKEGDISNLCFAEFSAWCQATKARIQRGQLKIYVHIGDAFQLCEQLAAKQLQGGPNEYPYEFDVIDTSNLVDRVHLLNVLLNCKLLLKRGSLHSTLFTECNTLRTNSKGMPLNDILEQWLGMKVELFSLLTGLVVMDFPCSTSAKMPWFHADRSHQSSSSTTNSHIHLTWKCFDRTQHVLTQSDEDLITTSIDKVSLTSSDAFVALVMNIYDVMFRYQYDGIALTKFLMKHTFMTDSMMLPQDSLKATPQCFALLLRHLLDRFDDSLLAKDVMLHIVNEIKCSGFSVQGHVNQDIILWLAYYGVLSEEDLQCELKHTFDFLQVQRDSTRVRRLLHSVCGPVSQLVVDRSSMLIQVTLLVPYAKIESIVNDCSLNCPLLEIAVVGRFENLFHSVCITPISSKVFLSSAIKRDSWTIGQLIEVQREIDSMKISRNAFDDDETSVDEEMLCACTFLAPLTSLVFDEMQHIHVILKVANSAMNRYPDLPEKLGIRLCIAQAKLNDRSRISLETVPYGSNVTDQLLLTKKQARYSLVCAMKTPVAQISIPSSTAATSTPYLMTVRIDLEEKCLDLLLTSSSPKLTPCLKQSCRPNEVHLLFVHPVDTNTSHVVRKLLLPVPIDIERARIQISRKQGYCNLLFVPLTSSNANNMDRFAHLFLQKKATAADVTQFSLYGTSFVCLDLMPAVKVNVKSELSEIMSVMAKCGVGPSSANTATSQAWVDWKRTVLTMINHFTESEKREKAFAFAFASDQRGVEIIVFVNDIRVEYSIDRSVVLDVAVCIIAGDAVEIVAPWHINNFQQIEQIKRGAKSLGRHVTLSKEEMTLWKKMLPALVERCRMNWSHDPISCEYVTQNRVPVGDRFANGEQMFCRCCLGKQLTGTAFEKFVNRSEATDKRKITENFARAAIPLVYVLK